MSAVTLALFIVSVGLFLVLLSLAIYLLLVQQQQAGIEADFAVRTSAFIAPVFSCDVEVVSLDEHLQITNMDEPQVRMDGTGLGRGLRLVTEDQLQLTLQPGTNQFRLYSMGSVDDESEDKEFLVIRVSPEFIEVKPVLKYVNKMMEVMIWKLKPYSLKSDVHLAERQVFCGYLQKTVHFAKSPGKYYRFIVTTSGPQNRLASFASQSNAAAQMRKHRLLTLRVQADRVTAANQSGLPMQVVVRHRSDRLKRRLTQEMGDLPLNGTYSFTLLRTGQGIQKPRKALRLHLSEKQVLVEPHSRFGSLPLSCDVFLPDSSGDSPTQIVSGEFLSALQLPRATHRYVLTFYLHMKGSGVASLKDAPSGAWTSERRAHYYK